MDRNNVTVKSSGGGIGCFTALGLIFIALKLAEVGQVAKWSWWWVLAPWWIPVAFVCIVLAIVFIFVFISKIAV